MRVETGRGREGNEGLRLCVCVCVGGGGGELGRMCARGGE